MVVGVLRIKLGIPQATTLKEKRSVVKRVISRVKANFDVAISEVDHNDFIQTATLGVVSVGNNPRFVNSVLDKVGEFITNLYLAPVEDRTIEIMHVLQTER